MDDYITANTIARYAMVDARTAKHRLTRAGLDPDAFLHEPSGISPLYHRERLATLINAVSRSKSVPLAVLVAIHASESITNQ